MDRKDQFSKLKQEIGMGIAEFKKQFEEVYELGFFAEGEKMSEAEQALTFLKRLDHQRHGEMFIELQTGTE